ncbi:MAG: type II secretion system protein [Epsilonproteobacteria bacterium]|nr:type II secretion system protein [Campylobacterota bacterium]
MKRDAFTMIELIFVIVILGVLATVATARFLAIKQNSEDTVSQSFAGTMTRTVGHSLWSKSLMQNDNGSLKVGNSDKFYGDPLSKYVDIPSYFDSTTVDFSQCVKDGESANPFLQKASNGKYNVFCRDGNATTAPKFVVAEGGSYQF